MNRHCSKMSYASREAALADIKYIHIQQTHFNKMHQGSAKNGRKMRPYACNWCGNWHITSQTKRKYKHANN